LDGFIGNQLPPKGKIAAGKKIEDKFIVLLIGWQITHHRDFLPVMFEFFDEFLNHCMLLLVLYRKDNANGGGLFIGKACS
jgi:hypothetical protein